MGKITYISAEGLKKLKSELDQMVNVQRPAISKNIGEAPRRPPGNHAMSGCRHPRDAVPEPARCRSDG